jgi:transcription antitermination factor NusG
MPEKFCSENDKIGHSTLYKGVHGLGASLEGGESNVKDRIESLKEAYMNKKVIKDTIEPVVEMRSKSLRAHTIKREKKVKEILLPLYYYLHLQTDISFAKAFYRYIRPLRLIITGLAPPVTDIYK